jgi:hypothetical protein
MWRPHAMAYSKDSLNRRLIIVCNHYLSLTRDCTDRRVSCSVENILWPTKLTKVLLQPNFADPAGTRVGPRVAAVWTPRRSSLCRHCLHTPPRLVTMPPATFPFRLIHSIMGPSELWSHVTELQSSARTRAVHVPIPYLKVYEIPQPTHPSTLQINGWIGRRCMGPALEP